MTEPKEKSRAMKRIEELIAKKQEEEKAVLDGRYHEIESIETDAEAHDRMMNDRGAWT